MRKWIRRKLFDFLLPDLEWYATDRIIMYHTGLMERGQLLQGTPQYAKSDAEVFDIFSGKPIALKTSGPLSGNAAKEEPTQ